MNTGISRHIPNFITSLNLFSGCMALVFVFKGNIPVFSSFVAACLVLDFLDGFAARLLNANSPIGKDLDSLADMVAFGVVPGAILYHLFMISPPLVISESWWTGIIVYFPFIVTVFSGLRLAKFNNDTRQSTSFLGLPTPAVTIFVTGLALIIQYDRFHLTPFLLNSFLIAGIAMTLSFLLVSEIPLFAMKFRSFGWAQNRPQYLLAMISVVVVSILQFAGIPLLIIFYLILSFINNKFRLNRETPVLNESK